MDRMLLAARLVALLVLTLGPAPARADVTADPPEDPAPHPQASDLLVPFVHEVVRGGTAVAASCVNFADPTAGGPTGCYLDLAGVPPGATIRHAYMYWTVLAPIAPVPSGTPVFVATTVVPVPLGMLIATPCFDGQSFTAAFRADVTGLVWGNGRYPVSGFVSSGAAAGVITEGATLVVIYEASNCSQREIVLFDGLDVVNPSRPDFMQTITGFTAPPAYPVPATLVVVAGNGQVFSPDYDDPVFFNAADMKVFRPDLLTGSLCAPDGLYDRTVIDVSNIVTPSATSAALRISYAGDCYTVCAVALAVETAPGVDALVEPSDLVTNPTATPLRVSKLGSMTLVLRWEDLSASGYQLWRGHVGRWYDHEPVACGLSLPFTAVPIGTTNDYFLAVTSGCGISTSSAGNDSLGRPRPTAGMASGRTCP